MILPNCSLWYWCKCFRKGLSLNRGRAGCNKTWLYLPIQRAAGVKRECSLPKVAVEAKVGKFMLLFFFFFPFGICILTKQYFYLFLNWKLSRWSTREVGTAELQRDASPAVFKMGFDWFKSKSLSCSCCLQRDRCCFMELPNSLFCSIVSFLVGEGRHDSSMLAKSSMRCDGWFLSYLVL